MQAINWLELQPQAAEIEALNTRLSQAAPLRKARQLLVYLTLQGCPWSGRGDLIPIYHPSETYTKGQSLALPLPDPQKLRPTVWQVVQVQQAHYAENPLQGRFQVLTLEVGGKEIHVTGGLAPVETARFPRLNLPYDSDDLEYPVNWFAETFARSLQATLEDLIRRGLLRGQIVGDTHLPGSLAPVSIRPEALVSFFSGLTPARPWVEVGELVRALPELGRLETAQGYALLRAALKDSPYRALGGDRWTTSSLYESINREVPRGLPAARIRSKLNIWTDEDARDLAGYSRKSLPVEARQALDELETGDTLPAPLAKEWLPPASPVKLPTLNYLHITQAYFPVDGLLRAFAPEARLVFIQFIEGPHQPFLLDRDTGQLKALRPETLRDRILESNIPAGTYLWLEYQGGENYRIAPRPLLPASRIVPCKLASLQSGLLHIEHTQIPMFYEGDPYVFKANMRFEDIEALFAEARQANISVRDAIIYAVQELCESDPRQRAHRADIFNAVFLKRMCSPNSVSLLLYTEPCFVQLGEGFFRYRPAPRTVERASPTAPELEPASRVSDVKPHLELTTLLPEIEPAQPAVPALAEMESLVSPVESSPDLSILEEPAESAEPIQTIETALEKTAPDVPNEHLLESVSSPAPSEPSTRQAFDYLLSQLQDDLLKAREQGQWAIQQGLFAEAERFARQGEDLKARIAYLKSLDNDWETLVQLPVAAPDLSSAAQPGFVEEAFVIDESETAPVVPAEEPIVTPGTQTAEFPGAAPDESAPQPFPSFDEPLFTQGTESTTALDELLNELVALGSAEERDLSTSASAESAALLEELPLEADAQPTDDFARPPGPERIPTDNPVPSDVPTPPGGFWHRLKNWLRKLFGGRHD